MLSQKIFSDRVRVKIRSEDPDLSTGMQTVIAEYHSPFVARISYLDGTGETTEVAKQVDGGKYQVRRRLTSLRYGLSIVAEQLPNIVGKE